MSLSVNTQRTVEKLLSGLTRPRYAVLPLAFHTLTSVHVCHSPLLPLLRVSEAPRSPYSSNRVASAEAMNIHGSRETKSISATGTAGLCQW